MSLGEFGVGTIGSQRMQEVDMISNRLYTLSLSFHVCIGLSLAVFDMLHKVLSEQHQ